MGLTGSGHEDFGQVLVCADARVNVLSGSVLIDEHRVVVSSSEIEVTVASGTVYHFRRRGALFVCNVDDDVCRLPQEQSTEGERVHSFR